MSARQEVSLNNMPSAKVGENFLFQDENMDALKVSAVNIRLSTFQRIGIKKAEFSGGNLTQSIFENVYGREAVFRNVNFTGSIFRNCNFQKATFQSCDFRYCYFYNCLLPDEEMKACLPSEPNLKKELACNLKMNYLGIGKKSTADTFLGIEIQASEDLLLEIFKSKTSYYKDQYDLLDRLDSLRKYFVSKLAGLIWGYGYRYWMLLCSYLVFMILLATIVFIGENSFFDPEGQIVELSYWQCIQTIFYESLKYSFTTMKPIGGLSSSILFISRFLGIIYLGLLGATLYRRIAR